MQFSKAISNSSEESLVWKNQESYGQTAKYIIIIPAVDYLATSSNLLLNAGYFEVFIIWFSTLKNY